MFVYLVLNEVLGGSVVRPSYSPLRGPDRVTVLNISTKFINTFAIQPRNTFHPITRAEVILQLQYLSIFCSIL